MFASNRKIICHNDNVYVILNLIEKLSEKSQLGLAIYSIWRRRVYGCIVIVMEWHLVLQRLRKKVSTLHC